MDWTAEALLSLSSDADVSKKEVKAYAAWELDYRVAYDTPDPVPPKLELRGDDRKLDALLVARKGA
jgi:hypothetical protein